MLEITEISFNNDILFSPKPELTLTLNRKRKIEAILSCSFSKPTQLSTFKSFPHSFLFK